jgi:hypothetical protein
LIPLARKATRVNRRNCAAPCKLNVSDNIQQRGRIIEFAETFQTPPGGTEICVRRPISPRGLRRRALQGAEKSRRPRASQEEIRDPDVAGQRGLVRAYLEGLAFWEDQAHSWVSGRWVALSFRLRIQVHVEGAMEIGTKKWHESVSDMGWEVLALAGCLMQAAMLAIIIAVVRLVN